MHLQKAASSVRNATEFPGNAVTSGPENRDGVASRLVFDTEKMLQGWFGATFPFWIILEPAVVEIQNEMLCRIGLVW